MYIETRKINLIGGVLKIDNEDTIAALETIVKKSMSKKAKKSFSAKDFLGVWSKEESILIEKAIGEGCEQIN